MYLKATIETSTTETNALPNEAIVSTGGKSYCFVQNAAAAGAHGYKFRMLEVITGITDEGFTEVTLPDTFDVNAKNIVLKGAYDLLSKMNNSEEEGHAH
jgi:cobalt-zinc-cadmium efflux system membrane fusion protein